jgi:hypothetical protein
LAPLLPVAYSGHTQNTILKNRIAKTPLAPISKPAPLLNFFTPYGKAVIGKNSNRNLGSMAVDTTWLLLSTNSSEVTADEMALVFQNLKTY